MENPANDSAKEARLRSAVRIFGEGPTNMQEIPIITEDRIQSILNALQVKKSPGLDQVRNAALKKLPQKVVKDIVNITNDIPKIPYFPQTWKRARITLIHKKGENTTSDSAYRSISLLPSIGKAIERAILTEINDFIYDNNILPEEQCGFRAALGTTAQTTRMVSDIIWGFNRQQKSGVLFLDVGKAFDKVWHNGLIVKMIRVEFPNYLIKVIKSFLSNRSFLVHLDGQSSGLRPVQAGVPQGSPLASVLYNI